MTATAGAPFSVSAPPRPASTEIAAATELPQIATASPAITSATEMLSMPELQGTPLAASVPITRASCETASVSSRPRDAQSATATAALPMTELEGAILTALQAAIEPQEGSRAAPTEADAGDATSDSAEASAATALSMSVKGSLASCWSINRDSVDGVPRIEPWTRDCGCLLDALSVCGAVYLDFNGSLPDPHFERWHALFVEALTARPRFNQRPPILWRMLKFSNGEDLARTLEGGTKQHTPDVRHNFGVAHDALCYGPEGWGDLNWISEDFRASVATFSQLMCQEIAPLASDEPNGTLGAKVCSGREIWGGSRLRHSVYPANGSCTEHTDYGAITLQQSTCAGLLGMIRGEWRPLHPPTGCALVFAGDMLERLTNGRVPALKHRVCLNGVGAGSPSPGQVERQSQITFLQPDRNTIVQPLRHFIMGDGTDLPPVRYGDWHSQKTRLAFRHY